MTASQSAWPPCKLPVLVVQPLPGIGDMVWHLPHIRAIAAAAGEPVTLMTKPRSLADQLLVNDPAIAGILWLDLNPSGRRGRHDGLVGFVRLVRELRAGGFGSAVLLHHSDLLAAAAWLAGIPDRRGYGWGRQRWFLNTGPLLSPDVKKLHQHTRATRYVEAAGIPMASAEPSLTPSPSTRMEAMNRLGSMAGPFVAIGIGSSEPLRQWGAERFGELTAALLDAGWPAVVLVGGLEDEVAAHTIMTCLGTDANRVRQMLGHELANVMGMLSSAAFYVGNNTGVMNIAAATGTRTYALFGTTAPFHHASQIVPVTVLDTETHDGMQRLTVQSVLNVIHADRGRLSP